MTERIWGEGEPGNRPCQEPDNEAPWDWDDPAICRRKAVARKRLVVGRKGWPVCDVHAKPEAGYVIEPMDPVL